MSLTPADAHNPELNRPSTGERGYGAGDRTEQVERLLDLVEDDLVRHIEERDELRDRTEALRNREAVLEKADAKLRQKEAELRQQAAELRQRGSAFQQQVAELRQREAAVQQQAAELRRLEAAVQQEAAELRKYEMALNKREAALHQQKGRVGHLGTARRVRVDQQVTTVSEEQRFTTVRKVTGQNGSNDPEWTAIRSAADLLGADLLNGDLTETVKQHWTRVTELEPEASEVPVIDDSDVTEIHEADVTEIDDVDVTEIESAQVKQLQQVNAELNHVNDVLKATVARYAAELPSDSQMILDGLEDLR